MLAKIGRREMLLTACASPLLRRACAAETLDLRAGPLTLVFQPDIAFVRYVRLGDTEVLRGIYAAVRDSVWGTVAIRVRDLRVKRSDGGFVLTFAAEHKAGEIDFAWDGTITGTREGMLRFDFDGKARSTFQRNRIGFCVLHPMREVMGQPCTVEKTDGTVVNGSFPDLISPHQPFLDIRAIGHTIAPGLRAEVRMQGDTFEMEDHRNWTDANFKTYCTPLANPVPVKVDAGASIRQSVILTLRGDVPRAPAVVQRTSPVEVRITDQKRPMPRIGLGYSRVELGGRSQLRELSPAHIRVDLNPAKSGWKDTLAAASALGIPLEVAFFGPADVLLESELQNVARVLIFNPAHRGMVGSGKPVLLGTNDYFTELNRQRPKLEAAEGTCYSINPQVHAFDDASLVENLAAQGDTVRTARSFAGARWIAVTPVTLRPRFVPASGKPVQPDPRQSSEFAAAWTLGSIKALAEAGANSVTYYEVAGPGGILGFPVEKVFSIVQNAENVLISRSSDSLRIECAVFTRGSQRQVVLANMTPGRQRGVVEGKTFELSPYEVRII